MMRVVEVKGEKSDWFVQAKFWLKEDIVPPHADSLTEEAEKLIGRHMKTSHATGLPLATINQESRDKWIDRFFICSLIALGITTILYIV